MEKIADEYIGSKSMEVTGFRKALQVEEHPNLHSSY